MDAQVRLHRLPISPSGGRKAGVGGRRVPLRRCGRNGQIRKLQRPVEPHPRPDFTGDPQQFSKRPERLPAAREVGLARTGALDGRRDRVQLRSAECAAQDRRRHPRCATRQWHGARHRSGVRRLWRRVPRLAGVGLDGRARAVASLDLVRRPATGRRIVRHDEALRGLPRQAVGQGHPVLRPGRLVRHRAEVPRVLAIDSVRHYGDCHLLSGPDRGVSGRRDAGAYGGSKLTRQPSRCGARRVPAQVLRLREEKLRDRQPDVQCHAARAWTGSRRFSTSTRRSHSRRRALTRQSHQRG